MLATIPILPLLQHPDGSSQRHPEVHQGAAEHVQEPRDLLASLHPARLQPSQRGGGAAHPPRQLRDHQHASYADTGVSEIYLFSAKTRYCKTSSSNELHNCWHFDKCFVLPGLCVSAIPICFI